MRKFFAFALVLCFIPLVCGCVPLIIGAAAGGLGAYAVGRDMLQGDSDKGFDLLWESAINVAKQRGIIQQENMQTGYMELNADSSKIWIRLIRLTQATTRIRISARKYSFPNMELAQDFFVRIVTGVK